LCQRLRESRGVDCFILQRNYRDLGFRVARTLS
jgi:hypothetical protein